MYVFINDNPCDQTKFGKRKLPYMGQHLRGKFSYFEWKIAIQGKPLAVAFL